MRRRSAAALALALLLPLPGLAGEVVVKPGETCAPRKTSGPASAFRCPGPAVGVVAVPPGPAITP